LEEKTLNFEPPLKKAGFTLLELLVVISLISLLFFLAIPRFESGLLTDASRRSILQMKQAIEAAKTEAEEKQLDCTLHLALDTRQWWTTHEAMGEEERITARRQGSSWADGLQVESVSFPGGETATSGEVALYFYRKGYSDRARIYLRRDDGTLATLLVEPFLSRVRIEDGHVSFRQ
jgi:prepilin-type N-terminal cleavage/methylation domain-containing protein